VDVVVFLHQTPPIVSIVARPETRSAWVRLIGDLDLAAESALADAVDRLKAQPLRLIVIDLTAVTFACSTLANFLAVLHRAHPDSELVLHHPPRMVRVILALTGLDACVTMSRQPFGDRIGGGRTAGRR
jgi:anti-anti-sigma factor